MAKTVLAGFDGSSFEKPMTFAILFNTGELSKDRFYRLFALRHIIIYYYYHFIYLFFYFFYFMQITPYKASEATVV